jgi:GNAT superfamily N-acetyltransferase
MRALWRHVTYNFSEGGLRQVLFKVFWRFRQWFWSESSWLIYRLETPDYQRESRLLMRRECLSFDQLLVHGYFKVLAFPEAIQRRFASGAICHGFFLGEELANIAWTTENRLELEGCLSIPEENCVGIFDCFTLPPHRSKGVYTDTLVCLVTAARDHGERVALIAVDPDNLPSIRGIERAGFQPMYRLTQTQRFGRHALIRSVFQLHSK